MTDNPKFDALVQGYLISRNTIESLKEEHKAEIAPYKKYMDELEAYFLQHFSAFGTSNFKTPHGTVYTKMATTATVKDWPALWEFILANDAGHILTRSVAKTEAAKLQEEMGQPLPGVQFNQVLKAHVLSPKE